MGFSLFIFVCVFSCSKRTLVFAEIDCIFLMNICIPRVVLSSPSYSASCVLCVCACVSEFVFAIEMFVFMLLVVHINYLIDNGIVNFYGISFVPAKVFLLQK
jgi:hypothetical protein